MKDEKLHPDLIELKELRIGNILMYKEKYVYVSQLSMDIDDEYEDIIGITEVGRSSGEIADWNRTLYGDLKRVPIAPPLLTMCGFVNIGSDDFHKDDLWSIPDSDYKYCEGGWVVDNAGYYGHFCDLGHDVKNLHSLQNLFFLLEGKELNIRL